MYIVSSTLDLRSGSCLLLTKLGVREEKKIVHVPFMQDDSLKIVKVWRHHIGHKKKFNIKRSLQTLFKNQIKIGLAVVPIDGIDARNKRMGF